MATIGILALQGDFDKHSQMITSMGHRVVLVKTEENLSPCDGLILPGGESTTLVHLMKKHGLWDAVYGYGLNRPVFGTCAGLIVLASEVVTDYVETLGLLNVSVSRNAYGRQVDSFIDTIDLRIGDEKNTFEGIFIRAPKIVAFNGGVEALAWHKRDVVLVRNEHILAASFHPELTDDRRLHDYFIRIIESRSSDV
jgi:5'-phosphate synthase pdxT subunit